MQIAAANVPVSNQMTQSQQAHCRDMMNNDTMDMLSDGMNDCECCSDICSSPAALMDFYSPLLNDVLSNAVTDQLLSQPISITQSLYRPPINV